MRWTDRISGSFRLESSRYAKDFNEVKRLSIVNKDDTSDPVGTVFFKNSLCS